jgi:hypothetical protein
MKNLSLRHSDAVTAWATNNPVELVTAAVGALDRFLLGMVCLVFGLGSYELFLARSNREGEIRDKRLKKLSWLRVTSIGAFYTLVPIRPRSRGERRSLRTLPVVSLRPGSPAFNPRPRRLSTSTDAFQLHPDEHRRLGAKGWRDHRRGDGRQPARDVAAHEVRRAARLGVGRARGVGVRGRARAVALEQRARETQGPRGRGFRRGRALTTSFIQIHSIAIMSSRRDVSHRDDGAPFLSSSVLPPRLPVLFTWSSSRSL